MDEMVAAIFRDEVAHGNTGYPADCLRAARAELAAAERSAEEIARAYARGRDTFGGLLWAFTHLASAAEHAAATEAGYRTFCAAAVPA